MIGEQEVCEMGFPACKFILENGANFSHQYVHHNMTVILLNFFLSHTCSYCHWPHRSRVYVTVGCTSVRHSVRLSIIRTPLLWVCCWAPGGVRHIDRLLHGAPACVSTCGQCHLDSWRMMLNTGLFLFDWAYWSTAVQRTTFKDLWPSWPCLSCQVDVSLQAIIIACKKSFCRSRVHYRFD